MQRTRALLLSAFVLTLLAVSSLAAQSDPILSGPMVCASEMREVKLWVQTRRPSRVSIVYRDTAVPGRAYTTHEIRTATDSACVAHLVADSVEPGHTYRYEVMVDGKIAKRAWPLIFRTPPLWQWRTDPPNFRVATGSCAYINEAAYDRPGTPYGGSEEIFTSIALTSPDIMLWLGDNVYLREADWYSRTGVLRRYTHTRSLPQLQPLLGASANYAIWDDHDFGPNDADRAFRGAPLTLEAFKLFWDNPSYGIPTLPGCATTFEWGDVQFFLLDDRSARTPNRSRVGPRTILGDDQIRWLVDGLVSSNATFKIVAIGGQVLNPVAKFENYATYPEEREKLLKAIQSEGVRGVIILSGDRHHTELTGMAINPTERGGYTLYDLTVSPLTSTPAPDSTEANTLRVPGTFVGERNFATLDFAGARNDRSVTIQVRNASGKLLWERRIAAKDLGYAQ